MKKALFAAAALVVVGSFVSIVGIVADANHLTFWTQALMWSLLGTVLVVPALVFAGSPAFNDASPTNTSGTSRSLLRTSAYVFSGVAFAWTAVSFVSLFVYPEHLEFWTQSVLWSLLVLLVWAPIMTFVINPFEDPSFSPDATRTTAGLLNQSRATQDTPSSSSDVADQEVQDFVPEQVVNVQPRTIPPKEEADINTSVFDEDVPPPSSSVDWPDEPAS